MKAEIMLDLPPCEGYKDGDVVAVVSGLMAGIWVAKSTHYGSHHGGYSTNPQWVGSNSPEGRAIAELSDLAATALWSAGLQMGRRAVWPGPSKKADEALEAAIALKNQTEVSP